MGDFDDAGARGELVDQRIGLGLVGGVEIGVPFVEQIDFRVVDSTISWSDLSCRSPEEKPSFLSIDSATTTTSSSSSPSTSTGTTPPANWNASRSVVGQ